MNENPSINYDFVAPQRIVFGWGRRDEAGTLATTLGHRAFIACGSRTLQARGAIDELAEILRREGVEPVPVETLSNEPEVDDVDRATAAVRQHRIVPGDFLLAVGGGAAMDLAKAVAAMATNDKSPTIKDYLEGVGRGLTLVEPPLPVMAMPTTAGTGTEATKNAVISSYDPPFKKSLRDHRIVPRVVLIDPELTVSAPPPVTAASGMDAITQLFESYISCRAKPIPQALAKQGLQLALPAIAEAVQDGTQREPREAMAHAALLSGMCLANSGLGMAHGVAPALGVHCRVPHGAACALMLPVALKANRDVRLKELALLAHGLGHTGMSNEDAVDSLIEEVEQLCITVGVPRRLSEVGVTAEQIPAIVKSSRGNSMSGNPRKISDVELAEILEGIL